MPDATSAVGGIDFNVSGGPTLYDIEATIPSGNAVNGKLFGRLQANE